MQQHRFQQELDELRRTMAANPRHNFTSRQKEVLRHALYGMKGDAWTPTDIAKFFSRSKQWAWQNCETACHRKLYRFLRSCDEPGRRASIPDHGSAGILILMSMLQSIADSPRHELTTERE